MTYDFDLIIEGATRPSADGKRMEVRSPASGELVGSVARATDADADAGVRFAHGAFKVWAARTAYDRERTIRKATAHARTKADEVGRVMALEQGKPLAQCKSEVLGACDTIDYYAAEGVRVEGYTNPTESPDLRSWVIHQPVGVCAMITPWNYPVSLLSWKLGPALAVGCAMVVKPTQVTPLSPTAFCKALLDGGIPAGVISVITGPGASLGEALVRHPLVAKVAMTGSSATGKRIMAVAGPHLKKVSLELGGQCPAIVCADADLDQAAKVIVYKGFRNMGQSCSGINRVYAHRSVYEPLAQRVAALAQKLTIGDGVSDPNVDLGPMATADGLRTTREHVADAVGRGAKVLCGGKPPDGPAFAKGHFYLPTVVTGATRDMRVMREETFGPVVPIAAFDDLTDAIAQANDTEYGLVSYLFTRDAGTTVRVSEALEAGTVCVNHGQVNTNYGPYCGWKDSGYGTELSRRSVYEYLKTKHVKVQV